jgi:hypothetical protein
MTPATIDQLSEQLLLAVKMQNSTEDFQKQLNCLSMDQLFSQLRNDKLKNAFWINIYNAFFQILRKELQLQKPKIFTKKLINIGGHSFSLDDIEHGILRRFRFKYSLGYLSQFCVPQLIKELAVKKIDYRIHFTLNCGAKSCPPIAFYSVEKINTQLSMATQSFLENETELVEESREVKVSRLFFWFMADFGGKTGIRKILESQVNMKTEGYKIVFKPYSWDEQLDNYSDTF